MSQYDFVKMSDISISDFPDIYIEDLEYFEYKEIKIENKKQYFINKLSLISKAENNISFGIFKDLKIVGCWVINKEEFDSEIFGIDIYRINNILFFERDKLKWDDIIQKSINYLKTITSLNKKTSYFLVGLNTNRESTPLLQNILMESGFKYIHTLLTFSMRKNEYNNLRLPDITLKIREATNSDVDSVVELAKKSFKYSRFHLDPFLDKEKANILLATSARNSIIEKYVDIIFVAELNNKVVGYYSAKKKCIKDLDLIFGDVVVSAVDENYRGLGIFKEMNKIMLKWFHENTDIAELGTYIANTPIHKTFTNNGLGLIRGTHQLAIQFYY